MIAGTTFGVTDTCGTVSDIGVRELQLVWLGATQPDGPEWVLDGYGCWTRLVPRSLVDAPCGRLKGLLDASRCRRVR